MGTAVEEDNRRSPNDDVGRACSGDRDGELGPEIGSGGSSSGKASSCHGCKPVRRVNSSRESSMERCGGVLGRSMPPDGVRYLWVPSIVRRGASARLPGVTLSPCAWASVSSSGSGVASATALSSKKDCSSYCRRCWSVLAGEAERREGERSCYHNINIHSNYMRRKALSPPSRIQCPVSCLA
jgi:hypothetical protein